MNLIYYFASVGCGSTSKFLGFPYWYEYLKKTSINGVCSPELNSLSDVWLIVAAVIEILLRVSALVAVGFVIYGGVKYTISQGNPDQTSQARTTIINAIAGLFIAISSAIVVQFIAGRIH